tara:strand:- start:2200 stop:3687 length:1488 start_codon:yes stop_codon:yes gene_type:complete
MEKFFWADQIADKIIKERGKKTKYVCASGITPSGPIHIGNFREVITTELVVRALRDKGKKVRFIYSWDDYDRFRKVPKGVKKEYEKYIGMPLSEIPSPFEKSGSYAKHFEKIFEKELEGVFIEPEFIRQNEMNKKSKYAELIKLALEKKEEIRDILNKYRKEPLSENWMPITVYCEKCGKDDTKVIDYEGYNVRYKCDCGKESEIDIRKKGIVKMPWRVDWPLRWKYEGVDFEPGGIDHSTPGGSFTTAKEISQEVFDFEPPVYTFYEWVRIKGGTEFSSSAGNVTTLSDVEEIYEPEVLRYLFVGTRPNKGFQISFDNDVIKIYEDFDSLEKKYFDKKANPQEKRIYELSQLKIPKKQPKRLGFRNLITYVQAGKVKDLKEIDKKRAEKVGNWLNKYAPEDVKFEVQDKINVKLNSKEKLAMKELKKVLEKKSMNEKKLVDEIYGISERAGISSKDFFSISYRVILNKEKGPRLAQLILGVGKGKIIKLLNQIK